MAHFRGIGWVEIPVTDMDRAVKFYEALTGTKLEKMDLGPLQMAMFPMDEHLKGASGALVKNENYKASMTDGVLIYFTTPSGNLDEDLKVVEAAGGKIHVPKKMISEEYGYMAVVFDTEGNHIALHYRQA